MVRAFLFFFCTSLGYAKKVAKKKTTDKTFGNSPPRGITNFCRARARACRFRTNYSDELATEKPRKIDDTRGARHVGSGNQGPVAERKIRYGIIEYRDNELNTESTTRSRLDDVLFCYNFVKLIFSSTIFFCFFCNKQNMSSKFVCAQTSNHDVHKFVLC